MHACQAGARSPLCSGEAAEHSNDQGPCRTVRTRSRCLVMQGQTEKRQYTQRSSSLLSFQTKVSFPYTLRYRAVY